MNVGVRSVSGRLRDRQYGKRRRISLRGIVAITDLLHGLRELPVEVRITGDQHILAIAVLSVGAVASILRWRFEVLIQARRRGNPVQRLVGFGQIT